MKHDWKAIVVPSATIGLLILIAIFLAVPFFKSPVMEQAGFAGTPAVIFPELGGVPLDNQTLKVWTNGTTTPVFVGEYTDIGVFVSCMNGTSSNTMNITALNYSIGPAPWLMMRGNTSFNGCMRNNSYFQIPDRGIQYISFTMGFNNSQNNGTVLIAISAK